MPTQFEERALEMSRVPETARMVSNRRFGTTRYLVPHESSLWFAKMIAIGAVTTGGLLGLISWFHHRDVLEMVLDSGFIQHPDLIERYARLSLTNGLMVVAATTVFITVIACFLLHRIAGPVFRLHQHMLSVINDENVHELRFRDGDRLSGGARRDRHRAVDLQPDGVLRLGGRLGAGGHGAAGPGH